MVPLDSKTKVPRTPLTTKYKILTDHKTQKGGDQPLMPQNPLGNRLQARSSQGSNVAFQRLEEKRSQKSQKACPGKHGRPAPGKAAETRMGFVLPKSG